MLIRSLSVAIILMLLAGCQLGNQQSAPPNGNHASTQQNNEPQRTEQRVEENATTDEVARRLANLASSVPHVNDATVVIIGNTAIVGLDVSAKLDRPRVGTLKYTVSEALKKDPYGKTAVVVADPDVAQRLREINEEIDRGRPLAGFVDELGEIVGRVMPQFPNAIPERPSAPIENAP